MALAKDDGGNVIQGIQPDVSQVISFTAASAQSAAVGTSAKRGKICRFWASQDCWIRLGTNPTAAKTANSHPITAKVDTYFFVPANYLVAVLRDSADGTLVITEDV